MRHLPVNSYRSVPWKNGGSLTREIALHSDAAGMIWRLSLADVSGDGPYSRFPGYLRILTTVTGAGTQLRDADHQTVCNALPFVPVGFSGDQTLQGMLVNGPIQNFNVIYDPARVTASAEMAETGMQTEIRSQTQIALFSLGKTLEVTDLDTDARPLTLQTHDTCMVPSRRGRSRRIRVSGRSLCVTLTPVNGGS